MRELIEEKNKTQESSKELIDELVGRYGSLEEAEKQYLLKETSLEWNEKIRQYINYRNEMNKTEREINELTDTISKDNKTIIYWEDLKEATITGNTEKINTTMQNLTTAYTTEGKNQEKALLDQLNAEINLANDRKKIWKENGIEINNTRREQLETGIKITADKLVEQANTVEKLSEDQIEAWKILAENSRDVYNEKISNVKEDTKLLIETLTNTTSTLTPEQAEKWANLAREDKNAYERNLSGLDEITRSKVQFAINAIKGKQEEAGKAGANVGNSIKIHFDSGLGDTKKSAENFIEGFTRVFRQKKSTEKALNEVKSFGKKLVSHFNAGLDEHSPSKETEKSAFYFIKGFTNKIQDMIPSSLQQIKGLALGLTNEFDNNLKISDISKGIAINPNDFKIDTNQFIDYGQISGAIATQSNINVSEDIEGRIEKAIYNAFSNVRIPVEIEATTDEGVVFKKVQVKAREFSMQTGEPAFDY